MHVQKITTDMINDFNECTLMRDYISFYYNYETSIKSSAEDFKRLNVSNSKRCHFITQNFLPILKFLRDYPHSDPRRLVCYAVEAGDPDFVRDLKLAINWRDWNSFYQKYSKIADTIIDQAREQRMLNISIEWNSKFYPSVEELENAKLSQRTQIVSKNSGEMLTLRPGTPPRREARNKYSPNIGSYAFVNSGEMLTMKPEPSPSSTTSSQNTVTSSPDEPTLTKLSRWIFGGHSQKPEAFQESQPKANEKESESLENANSSSLVSSEPSMDQANGSYNASTLETGRLPEQAINLGAAAAAPCDTQQEIFGDHSMQTQSAAPNQIPSAENTQSDGKVLPQSESLEQPSSENTDSALRTRGEAPETTIISEAEETMLTQTISSEMIKVFHDCASNKDYRNFYNKNEVAIKNWAEKLKLLDSPLSKRTNFITKNFLKIFKFLRDYPFCDERKIVPGCIVLEEDPEFLEDMRSAIDSKDWDSFYQKYWKIADFMINQAREQKVLDVTIEWKSNFYPNFESIRIAKLPPYKPYLAKNSGEMLTLRSGPSPYSSLRRQCSRNSSPNRLAESTPRRKYSFYRDARDNYNQYSSNQSFCGSNSQTNRNTVSSSEVRLAPRSLHFDNGSSRSQQQLASQANRSSQSDYRRCLTQHDEPLACSENTGSVFFSCCRALANQSVDYSSHSRLTRSSISSTMKKEEEEKEEEKGPTRVYQETRTGHSLHNREESRFQQQIDVLLDKGYQFSEYQESSPRPSDPIVGQDLNGAQFKSYDYGTVLSPHFEHEPRQKPFNTMEDHAAITSSELPREQATYHKETIKLPNTAKRMVVSQFHSLQPELDRNKERYHSEIIVPDQTANNPTAYSGYQAAPQATEQLHSDNPLEIEEPPQPTLTSIAVTRASREMHQDIFGGYSLQPSLVVSNHVPSTGSIQLNYQNLAPSEPLEDLLPEPIDNSLSSKSWETPEPTTLPQDFSLMNNSADMETLKKHDDSFEELESDKARPDDEDRNKQSSEDSEIVDDHRSSMSSINIDFSPVEDSIISQQSCFDLDDLRKPNDSPIESIDAKFDDELFKHQVEMSQVNQDVMRTENLITEELNAMQRQETIIPNNPDLIEGEEDSLDFNRQFDEMKRQQAEELRRIREERRRKQQKLDDELQRRTNEIPVEYRPTTSVDQVSTTEADGHRDEDAIQQKLKEKERKRQMARRKRNTKH
ncbi:hypothetical protein CAEBREN_07709 [Caenorhabditis brenneri]|uniref:Uncharacterized protein n=1 Tax=Caenorhabditis brenneri TaxID=135651 RepID=G0MA73_CAEBE|nr:hypothetical protein CAEBREN_07709 [Caenorhabditis brenneri]